MIRGIREIDVHRYPITDHLDEVWLPLTKTPFECRISVDPMLEVIRIMSEMMNPIRVEFLKALSFGRHWKEKLVISFEFLIGKLAHIMHRDQQIHHRDQRWICDCPILQISPRSGNLRLVIADVHTAVHQKSRVSGHQLCVTIFLSRSTVSTSITMMNDYLQGVCQSVA
jgi:hypothetical protein